MEKGINQTLKTDLVIIFPSFFNRTSSDETFFALFLHSSDWGKINKWRILKDINGGHFSVSLFFPQSPEYKKHKKCLIWWSSSVNKERNITTKPVLSVWFINFSNYFYHTVKYCHVFLALYGYRMPSWRSTGSEGWQRLMARGCQGNPC